MTLNRIFGIKYLFSDKIFFSFLYSISDRYLTRCTNVTKYWVITVLVIFRKTPFLVSVFINLGKWKVYFCHIKLFVIVNVYFQLSGLILDTKKGYPGIYLYWLIWKCSCYMYLLIFVIFLLKSIYIKLSSNQNMVEWKSLRIEF